MREIKYVENHIKENVFCKLVVCFNYADHPLFYLNTFETVSVHASNAYSINLQLSIL